MNDGERPRPHVPTGRVGEAGVRVPGDDALQQPDTSPTPGRKLRPSTVEALREDLERHRAFQAQFLDRYFPRIAERGSVEYDDIDQMTPIQADAMVYSMAKSIRAFKKDAGRQRARGVGLSALSNGSPAPNPGDDDADQYEIKTKQYASALRDICQVFGLENPL